jgi:hypothetical protein
MSAPMVVMNYCSGVPIRPARSWEPAAYERELHRIWMRDRSETGVVDGESIASDLHGLRVMLVPATLAETHPAA